MLVPDALVKTLLVIENVPFSVNALVTYLILQLLILFPVKNVGIVDPVDILSIVIKELVELVCSVINVTLILDSCKLKIVQLLLKITSVALLVVLIIDICLFIFVVVAIVNTPGNAIIVSPLTPTVIHFSTVRYGFADDPLPVVSFPLFRINQMVIFII
jgi:hypothetical protein